MKIWGQLQISLEYVQTHSYGINLLPFEKDGDILIVVRYRATIMFILNTYAFFWIDKFPY